MPTLGLVPTTDVHGTTLFYEVDGEGAPCVVLHGGLGFDHTVYRRTLGPLSPPLELVFLDHRGNGRSGRPPLETLTMAQLADDAVALADHLGHHQVIVFGHSYGGFVAQELAIRHPDRVRGLLLVDTTPGQLGRDESEDSIEPGPPQPPALGEVMASLVPTDDGLAAGLQALLPHYLHRRDVEEVGPLFADTVFDVSAMLRGFEVLASWSSIDRLSTVRCPTLLVTGRHDVFSSFPQAHRIARRIPGARVEIFEHSGHFPWLDEPDAFFGLVHDWLVTTVGVDVQA